MDRPLSSSLTLSAANQQQQRVNNNKYKHIQARIDTRGHSKSLSNNTSPNEEVAMATSNNVSKEDQQDCSQEQQITKECDVDSEETVVVTSLKTNHYASSSLTSTGKPPLPTKATATHLKNVASLSIKGIPGSLDKNPIGHNHVSGNVRRHYRVIPPATCRLELDKGSNKLMKIQRKPNNWNALHEQKPNFALNSSKHKKHLDTCDVVNSSTSSSPMLDVSSGVVIVNSSGLMNGGGSSIQLPDVMSSSSATRKNSENWNPVTRHSYTNLLHCDLIIPNDHIKRQHQSLRHNGEERIIWHLKRGNVGPTSAPKIPMRIVRDSPAPSCRNLRYFHKKKNITKLYDWMRGSTNVTSSHDMLSVRTNEFCPDAGNVAG